MNSELKAKDVMSPDPVCVGPSVNIRELARVFEVHEISGVPVVDAQGKVIGIVSKTDLLRRCSEGTDDLPPGYLFQVLSEQGDDEEAADATPEPLICAEDVMTKGPLMVGPEVSASAVARLMFQSRVHRVVVVDQEKIPLGIITSMDLIGALPRSH